MRRFLAIAIALFAAAIAHGEKAAAQTPPADPVSTPKGQCVPPDQLYDLDGDVVRNILALSSPDLCLRQEVFNEGRFRWVLQIIQNRKIPIGPLWAVPHDDEDAAFIAALHSVMRFGGTVVAVETNGDRFNAPLKGPQDRKQDPNRNFDAGSGAKCKWQIARSPVYTRRFMQWRPKNQPIVALHTNDPGYRGDGNDGNEGDGNVSMARALEPDSRITKLPAAKPMQSLSPNDTMVFVASRRPPGADAALARFVKRLNEQGIHVLFEEVGSESDCSLSNYAALRGIRNYVNVEVVHGDAEAQVRIVDTVMRLLRAGQGPSPVPGGTKKGR